MRRSRFRNAMGAAALVLAACGEVLAPLPDGAVRVDPLPVYAEWWSMTEQCSGLTRSFSSVEWYVVPGALSFSSGGRSVQGTQSGGRIVIAGQLQREGRLVRHEMLHVLLRGGGHPRAFFVGRCGLLVSCHLECPDESDAPPEAPGAVTVSEAQLEVTADVSPSAPSEAHLGGYFRLAISVRNPLDHPVTVQLTLPPAPDPTVTFRWDYHQNVFGVGGGELPRFEEWMRFGPGETKLKIFDFWIVPSVGPPLAGIYTFRGGYGEHWSAPVTVTITP